MRTIEQKPTDTLPAALRQLLPARLQAALDACPIRHAEELCLHSESLCFLRGRGQTHPLPVRLSGEELASILQRMCRGSLYAHAESINRGYLTLPDGIRVGICGRAATEGDRVIGVSDVSGLTLRIPHRVTVNTRPLLERLRAGRRLRGMLILAPPGGGKTTLLRALATDVSSGETGLRTVVVDSREELAPVAEDRARNLDVLRGYPRALGIEIAVRSLGAELILCDEIGNAEDADAILAAAGCGVPLIATAHGAAPEELLCRPAWHRLHKAAVFGDYVTLQRGGSEGLRYGFLSHREVSERLRESVE